MPRMQIRGRAPKAPATLSTRYEARFANGTHTVFDHERFGHGPAISTYKEAERVAADLNAGRRQWAA